MSASNEHVALGAEIKGGLCHGSARVLRPLRGVLNGHGLQPAIQLGQ